MTREVKYWTTPDGDPAVTITETVYKDGKETVTVHQSVDPAIIAKSRTGRSLELWVDRESFDTLKELLRYQSNYFAPQTDTTRSTSAAWEDGGQRLRREALKRLFDQIRDVTYPDV